MKLWSAGQIDQNCPIPAKSRVRGNARIVIRRCVCQPTASETLLPVILKVRASA
ncbi:hypothetical protein JN385_01440 [Atlantibacter hermannii]|nr:hypothetical protein [Atlantibacter hermannii]